MFGVERLRDDEFDRDRAALPVAASFAIGAPANVPKFGAGDQLTIGFAAASVRTFMADLVGPV